MTTTSRRDNTGEPDDPYLSEMERQAAHLAQTGQRLIQTVQASSPPPYPPTPLPHPQTQPQDVETVAVDSGRGDLTIAQPRPDAAKVRDYLQRQLATAACFLLAASLAKKLPLWEHRQLGAAAALFVVTLLLNATGAKPGQAAGERLWTAVELGERDSFHKHLQVLLLHREARYLILLEAAIGMLLADAFATAFLK